MGFFRKVTTEFLAKCDNPNCREVADEKRVSEGGDVVSSAQWRSLKRDLESKGWKFKSVEGGCRMVCPCCVDHLDDDRRRSTDG